MFFQPRRRQRDELGVYGPVHDRGRHDDAELASEQQDEEPAQADLGRLFLAAASTEWMLSVHFEDICGCSLDEKNHTLRGKEMGLKCDFKSVVH